MIENDIEELKKRRVPVGTSVDGRQEIKLRFCKSDVVEHKRQIGLIFKGSFLIRMINMRNNGQRLTGLAKIQKKIRENIDDYIEPSRRNDFKYKQSIEADLFRKAEAMMAKRRSNLKKNRYDHLIEKLKSKATYEQKNYFVESNVEMIMQYFNRNAKTF